MSQPSEPDLSFLQWCRNLVRDNKIDDAHKREWLSQALADRYFPWNGTCQIIYDHVKRGSRAYHRAAIFMECWEESGRRVMIDDDSSSETYTESHS